MCNICLRLLIVLLPLIGGSWVQAQESQPVQQQQEQQQSVQPQWPGVDNPQRARVNYMLNCQGCHGPEGTGTADGTVPVMKNFVGNFLRVDGGREFLVRVPGSANAALADDALAELLNWMLPNIAGATMPAHFVPFDAQEVGRLRRHPLADVANIRADLVAQMHTSGE